MVYYTSKPVVKRFTTEKRPALVVCSNFSVWKMDKFDFDKYDLIGVKEI